MSARRTGLLAALSESTLGRPLAPTERSALDAALSDCPVRVERARPAHGGGRFVEPTTRHRRHRAWSSCGPTGATSATPSPAWCVATWPGCSTARPPWPSTRLCPCSALDLSAISGSDILIGLVMTCASTWLEAALADPAGGQRLVVYDEAWRLLAQPALLARMQAQWKLSRAWGLANLMIVHRLSDLDAVGDLGSLVAGPGSRPARRTLPPVSSTTNPSTKARQRENCSA